MKKAILIIFFSLLVCSNVNAEFSKGTNMLKIAENMSPIYDFDLYEGRTSDWYVIVWRANKRYVTGNKGFKKAYFDQKFYLGELKRGEKVGIFDKKNKLMKKFILMEIFNNKKEVLDNMYPIVVDDWRYQIMKYAAYDNITLRVEEEERRIADEKKRIDEEKRIAEKKRKKAEKKITSSSQSSSTDDKIAQAKQICKDLGFKTKTEKFADCSLKMLSMQFEVQNRETSSDGGTQQKIVVNQGYSVGDAMIALSGIISDANNVRSSYGGGNCRIFQHAYHASLKCN